MGPRFNLRHFVLDESAGQPREFIDSTPVDKSDNFIEVTLLCHSKLRCGLGQAVGQLSDFLEVTLLTTTCQTLLLLVLTVFLLLLLLLGFGSSCLLR